MSGFSNRFRQLRLRHAKTLAGLFVITCMAIAVKPMLSKSSWAELFTGGYAKEYLVVWKLQDAVYGEITPVLPVRGSRVELLGQTIGAVEEIFLGDDSGNKSMRSDADHLIYRLKVKGSFAELAEEASFVRLREDFGGYGSAYFELTMPKDGQQRLTPTNPNVLFVDTRERSVRLTIEKALPELMVNLTAISLDLKTLVLNTNKFTEEQGELRQILKKLNDSLPDSEEKGLASLLLTPKDMQSLSELMANLNQLTRQLGDTGSKTSLAALFSSLTKTLKRYEDLVASLEKTSQSITDTSDAAQQTWLLKKHSDEIDRKRSESGSSNTTKSSTTSSEADDKKKRPQSTRR